MSADNKRKRTINIKEEKDSKKTKQSIMEPKSALDSVFSSVVAAEGNEDFRIITGTYERILYGINANWIKTENEKNGKSLKLAPIFIVPAHTGLIRTVGIGNQYLASGSTDEIIRLYDIKKRKEFGSLGGHHQGDILDIQFHDKYMFSASEDHNICLWRTKDWEYIKTLKGHKGKVNSFAIHPTGKIALSVSSDRTVIVWNLMTAKKASMTKLYDEGLKVLWNEKGDQYAILFDRNIKIYNVSDAQVSKTFEHRSKFHDMCFITMNGQEYLISGHEDKTIRLWDIENDITIELPNCHQTRIKTVSSIKSEGCQVLVSTSSDGYIKCWNLDDIIDKKGKDVQPIGEYNTKSRITCCTLHLGFHQ